MVIDSKGARQINKLYSTGIAIAPRRILTTLHGVEGSPVRIVAIPEVPGVGAPDEMTWVRLESADDGWSGITWGISDP